MRRENEFITNAPRTYAYYVIKTAKDCGFVFTTTIAEEVCGNARFIQYYIEHRNKILAYNEGCDMEIYYIARFYGWEEFVEERAKKIERLKNRLTQQP